MASGVEKPNPAGPRLVAVIGSAALVIAFHALVWSVAVVAVEGDADRGRGVAMFWDWSAYQVWD